MQPRFLDRLSDRQMNLLVILFGIVLYVPFAGSYGLWDPWESHYSEVARQMTYRGDFISLWWPCSPRDVDVFWSKPVLTFWLMSIGMHVLRIGLPGGAPGEMALGTRAEWAVRTPMCLMGVLGMWGLYLVASRMAGRRAGLIAAVAVGTSPMYSLIARQAMTDMPYVGPVTMALALVFLALYEDKDEELPRRTLGRFSFPHHPLVYTALGLFALIVVPQLLVDSIQLKLRTTWGGHEVTMYGAVAMIPYYVGFAAFVVLAARTRYKAPFYLYIAAMLCGLATLAKTWAPGLALPSLIVFAFLLASNGWRRLWRAQMIYGLAVSVLVVVVVAAPWHHAMLVRHGSPFWNELFGDNNWRRMMLGRHGDRGTFEYFIRELGYSVLPWIAIVPAAIATVAMRPFKDARRQGLFWFGVIWAVGAYSSVSLSMTKFHHYVLPAVPGIALAVACFLDDLLQRKDARLGAVVALCGLPLLFLVVQDLVVAKDSSEHFLWLFSYDYIHSPKGRPWPDALDFSKPLVAFAVLFGAGALALAWRRTQRAAVLGLCLAAIAFTYFLLDGFMPGVAPYWSQKNLLANYFKQRRSPDEKLVAFQMYWRGETFYTKNAIYEGPTEERTVFDGDGSEEKFAAYITSHRGHRTFFIYEQGRQSRIVATLPAETRASFKVLDETNNKFRLAQADL